MMLSLLGVIPVAELLSPESASLYFSKSAEHGEIEQAAKVLLILSKLPSKEKLDRGLMLELVLKTKL